MSVRPEAREVGMKVLMAILCLCLASVSCGESSNGTPDAGDDGDGGDGVLTNERWTSSHNLQVAIHQIGEQPEILTEGPLDFKPSWSKTGDVITFFRIIEYDPAMYKWKNRIGVINADGTGERFVTDSGFADCNQTWTRDGTNQIIFNRGGPRTPIFNEIYMTSPDASPGDEVMISDPAYDLEWAFSGLKDGRIFVDRLDIWSGNEIISQSFLLTPDPGNVGTYEEIQRPTPDLWHKLSVSPSETKVTYMHDVDGNWGTFNDAVLMYADLDVGSLTISDPVAFTDEDLSYLDEYPRWNEDESLIIYSSDRSGKFQLYAYRLADKETFLVSPDPDSDDKFGNFEGCPK
jgi:hypothetical protein